MAQDTLHCPPRHLHTVAPCCAANRVLLCAVQTSLQPDRMAQRHLNYLMDWLDIYNHTHDGFGAAQ
jgi:hypothetical protein